MRWTFEAFIHRVLDALPGGDDIRLQVQRWITGAVPIDDRRLQREVAYAKQHLSVLKEAARDVSRTTLLEFGAGRHLTVAMTLAAEGPTVMATDVSELMRADLVRDAARRSGISALQRIAAASDLNEALLELGVRYQKMSPGSFAGVPDASVDLVYSTSVLEHIPVNEIRPLLAEARRVLSPGGRMSLIVDYTDHYAYGDSRISSFNFLSVPAEKWSRRYSPSGHFQNRLRHGQTVQLIEDAGFSVEARDLNPPRDEDLTWLQAADLDAPYDGLSPEDLGIRSAHLVARHSVLDAS